MEFYTRKYGTTTEYWAISMGEMKACCITEYSDSYSTEHFSANAGTFDSTSTEAIQTRCDPLTSKGWDTAKKEVIAFVRRLESFGEEKMND